MHGLCDFDFIPMEKIQNKNLKNYLSIRSVFSKTQGFLSLGLWPILSLGHRGDAFAFD